MLTLDQILQSIPHGDKITEDQKAHALSQSLVPDANGVWPSHEGYIATYDVFYAALSLVDLMEAQPAVTQASSEGTSVSTTAVDWSKIRKWLASGSVVAGNQLAFTVIPLPYDPGVSVYTDVTAEVDSRGFDSDYS